MKVLFLPDTGIPDFLQDAVFHGLHALLGDDVVEWPPLPRYRGASPPDGERYPFAYFDLPPHPGGTLEELLDWCDAVVMPSLRDGALPQVRAALGRKPTAFVDGEDHPYVRGIVRHVDLYFKRETLVSAPWLRARTPARRVYHYLRDREYGRDSLRQHVAVATARNVIPLPFGIIDVGFEPEGSDDEYGIAFLGRITSRERERLVEDLQRVGVPVFVGGGDLPWPDYMKALSRTFIAVSVRGLGYDTLRYWEIPYAGALLLAEVPRVVIPDNFVDGKEAVFAPFERLAWEAEALIHAAANEDYDFVGAMAARGREAVLSRHTSVHRAQAVLERLASIV